MYNKTNWQNLPNQTTPINSTNLNKIENGIADSYNSIGVDAYDNTSTYAVGDYCIYNNTLYKCTTAIETAEEWTDAHWEQTSVMDEIPKFITVVAQDTISVPANNGVQSYSIVPTLPTGYKIFNVSAYTVAGSGSGSAIFSRGMEMNGAQTQIFGYLLNVTNSAKSWTVTMALNCIYVGE